MGCCCGSHDDNINIEDIVYYKLFPDEKNKIKKKKPKTEEPSRNIGTRVEWILWMHETNRNAIAFYTES